MNQLTTFHVGRELYGIDIDLIHEIIISSEITHVPAMPAYVEGIINLRGEIFPVVDLRLRFDSGTAGAESRVLITRIHGVPVGLRVDMVDHVLKIENVSVRPAPPMLSGLGARFVSHVCDRPEEQGGGLVMVLALDKLFKQDELEFLQQTVEKTDELLTEGLSKGDGWEKGGQKKATEDGEGQILEFLLRGQRYGIDILSVVEVITWMKPTTVFQTPDYVLGVINVRGDILSLFDMASFFNLEKLNVTEKSRILVVQSTSADINKDAGFVVDQVIGGRYLDRTQVYPPPPTIRGNQRAFISGVVEEKDGPLILLSINEIFQSEKVAEL